MGSDIETVRCQGGEFWSGQLTSRRTHVARLLGCVGWDGPAPSGAILNLEVILVGPGKLLVGKLGRNDHPTHAARQHWRHASTLVTNDR